MSTSGTTSFSVTELDIITDALSDLGVAEAGQPMQPEHVVACRRKLNMLVKQWVSQADFAPGLKMWTRRRGWLFLEDGQTSYQIGPTGDECASETYASTSVSTAGIATDTFVSVESIEGMSAGDRVGVLLDSGSYQWTTISAAPTGLTVLLTDALEDAVSAGARVFAYTSKPLRPFEIATAVMRDTSGNDVPMDPHMSLAEYESIPGKSSTGTPSRLYFEAKKTNSVVYLDCAPEDTTKVVRFVYLSYVEDTTAQGQDVDFPAEWYRPLAAQLAMDCAGMFGRQTTVDMKLKRDEALSIARNAYPLNSTAAYESHPDCY